MQINLRKSWGDFLRWFVAIVKVALAGAAKMAIDVSALRDDLSFGARVTGLDWSNVRSEAVRARLRAVYEDRAVIVFEGMERSSEMHLAVSDIFGPRQDYPFKGVPQLNQETMLGLVDFVYDSIAEANGKPLCGWVPWHFDSCYTAKLNRGGVLRAIDIPAEGGTTGFVDGMQLFQDVSPESRRRFADLKILYRSQNMFENQRFGVPREYHWTHVSERSQKVVAMAADSPRSVHPAIWQRQTGEWVLHVSPWQAAGIQGRENAEGDATLEALCHEMYAVMQPYWHDWKPNDMVIWDNWRCLHSASGYDPKYSRRVQRTTIQGDYGLGAFEHAGATP
jgi:alpha-ketoglutarate-dependent taurine dioxygenase